MANITLNQYIKILSTAIHEYDGFGLADMLSLRDDHAINSNLFMINYHSATRTLPSPYDDLVAAHLQTLAACENKEWVSAFNHQVTTLDVFTKEFQQQKEENWCLPVMKELILDIRLLSIKGEEYAVVNKEKFKSGELIEQAAKSIMNVFRVCAGDTRTDINHSKRWGMLHVVNQLFKLYFRLNNFKLCKPLERAVNNSNLLDDFSIAQQVAYRYYVGRLKMFENDYTSAEEHLSFAHEKCFHLAEDNQRHILFYFITLRMLSGKMPTTRLLEKHNLQQFSEIATAVRIGNVRFFNSIMEKYEDFFIFRGIFLIVDKLRMLTYRNLFRRIAHILKTHQLPLKPFLNILHYLGEDDVDIDEIECIIANLIHQGYIKGYISHQHQKLVDFLMTKAKHKFEIGDLVFAKVRGYPHWPARVSPTDGHNVHVPKGKYFIIFYGTYETAVLNDRDLVAYNENSHSKYGNCKKPGFMNGMDELVNDPDITLRLRHGDESQVSENETVESELDQDVRASDSNKESSEQKIDLAPKDESLKQSTSDPDSSTAEKETDSPTIPDINSKSAIIKFEDVDVSQNENNDLPAVKSEEELSSEDEEIIVKKRRDGSIIKNSVQKDHLSKKKKLPSSESHDKRIKPRSKKPRTSISSTPVVQNKKKRAQSPLSSIGTVSEDEIYPTKSVLTKQQKPVRVSRSHEEQSCENTEVKRQNEQNKNPSHEVKRPEVQLQHLHLELMKSLSVKSTDHSKALSTMQAIDKLLIAETLKQSPDVVNTLRKVRKYQKDEAIRLKANQLYNKIKSLFLFSTSQDFIKDFMKSVELYRNEKDLKAREMKDVDKNTSQLLDEIKKTEETDSVSVQTVDPNNDIDAILVETTQQNELPGSETKVFEDQDTDNSLLLNSTSQKVKYWWEANGQNASDSHSSENESENSPAVPTALEESIKAPEKENVEEKGKPESELEIDWIDSVLGI